MGTIEMDGWTDIQFTTCGAYSSFPRYVTGARIYSSQTYNPSVDPLFNVE